MTWQRVVLELLDGIEDPEERIDMMSTIAYIMHLLEEGEIAEEQAAEDIADVVADALRIKNPLASGEELREEARRLAEAIIRAWRASKRRVEKSERYGLLGRKRRRGVEI